MSTERVKPSQVDLLEQYKQALEKRRKSRGKPCCNKICHGCPARSTRSRIFREVDSTLLHQAWQESQDKGKYDKTAVSETLSNSGPIKVKSKNADA